MNSARIVVKLSRRITPDVLDRFRTLVVPKLNDADSLILRVDSSGGSVQVAHAFAVFLQSLRGHVETYTGKGCQSAAVLIFAAGKQRIASSQAEFFVHEVAKDCTGLLTYSAVIKLAEELRVHMDMTTDFLAKSTGRPAHLWQKDMMTNRIINAKTAKRIGLVTLYGKFERQKGDINIAL